ncbi:hypothetical protein LVJ85_02365 [Neisseria sp. Dent CA1/247]|uniref:hypothetical protein n=1 Tax=Neisseria sp. Dent CA1/247 TaxID=2912675 RepID=UPI001FCFC4D2|nr:hypothetical protein [Neisseria sp. Dent CA1/247]UOO77363.1 hypothetical protein LVJ85_02365 [Neisseria sp. Dent CA1/247]
MEITNEQKQIIQVVLEKLEENWSKVFSSAKLILCAINQNGYDYNSVNTSVNPTIGEVIDILKKANEVFSAFEVILPHSGATQDQRYDFERVLLNSKQTVLHMERIMLSMQSGDIEECSRLQEMLTKQSYV